MSAGAPEPGRQPDAQEPVGSLAEEAARFADALSDWAQRHGGDGVGERLGGAAADLRDRVGQQLGNGLGQRLGEDWVAGVGSAAGHGASALAGLTALLGGAAGGAVGGAVGGSTECRVCPLCRLLGVLRGARPEVYEHLSAALASLLAAVGEAVAASERDWAYRRRGGLQHIDIG